ncbi:superoxide dismutase family protein [Sporosarcina sp. BI001-red]|uniref:superoxide dismutase family protein n=1 Tax=Sporosarcina sp. BI001-red TaxID=2282866 RepID=UPI000E25F96C|nr:superoxide dismutase family protein [Sporosarcina sp. BI001-red]REB07843.1 superoxide dismutase family protein [Sporosarcina sp. BI001-red]
MKRLVEGILIATLMIVLSGCGDEKEKVPVNAEATKTIETNLINTDGKKIGEAHVSEVDGILTISLRADGLKPGIHGIHLHEKAVCTPPDFKSAGGHFNPTDKQHGFDNPKGYHLGDLPNLEVGEDGKVSVKVTMHNLTLQPGKPNSLIDGDGSALVIHEDEDDYKTDPSGNSGDRIACAELKTK